MQTHRKNGLVGCGAINEVRHLKRNIKYQREVKIKVDLGTFSFHKNSIRTNLREYYISMEHKTTRKANIEFTYLGIIGLSTGHAFIFIYVPSKTFIGLSVDMCSAFKRL